MNPIRFQTRLESWASILPKVNAPLKAFGQQTVDISQSDWFERLTHMPTPLDEDENLRKEFDSLTGEIVETYLHCNEQRCQKIRELLSRFKGVLHFLGVPPKLIRTRDDIDLFRAGLVMLSIEDQEHDPRDTVVMVGELCSAARKAGIDPAPLLEEVAMLSSSADRYGMGSMRDILLRGAT